jgi:hypothetical protein
MIIKWSALRAVTERKGDRKGEKREMVIEGHCHISITVDKGEYLYCEKEIKYIYTFEKDGTQKK